MKFSILHSGNLDRTALLHLAELTALALGVVEDRDSLPNDSKVVQVWLYTVVWASSHSYLELMGQHHIMVSHIEELMEFLRKAEGIA